MALDFALFGYYPQDRGFIRTMILIQYNDEHGKNEKGCAFAHPLKKLSNENLLYIMCYSIHGRLIANNAFYDEPYALCLLFSSAHWLHQ